MSVNIWVLVCKIKKEISNERVEGTEVPMMKRHKRREGRFKQNQLGVVCTFLYHW